MYQKFTYIAFRVYIITHQMNDLGNTEAYLDLVELNDGYISYRKEFESLEDAEIYLKMSKGIDLTKEYVILPIYKFNLY